MHNTLIILYSFAPIPSIAIQFVLVVPSIGETTILLVLESNSRLRYDPAVIPLFSLHLYCSIVSANHSIVALLGV